MNWGGSRPPNPAAIPTLGVLLFYEDCNDAVVYWRRRRPTRPSITAVVTKHVINDVINDVTERWHRASSVRSQQDQSDRQLPAADVQPGRHVGAVFQHRAGRQL